MPDTYLRLLLEYNCWANSRLIDLIASLPESALSLGGAGAYGTLIETLAHFLTSEVRYQQYLTQDAREPERRTDALDLRGVRRLADLSKATLDVLVGRLPPADEMLHLHDGDRSAGTVLVQMITHAAEHRAQALSILARNGYELPQVDAWAHGIFERGDSWPENWGLDPR